MSTHVFALRPPDLLAARERARSGNARLRPALDALLAAAQEALTAGPWTVMAKAAPPPSGDKHDYFSFGPYWWPDPAQPDGLPFIRRDGEVNPDARDPSRADRPALGSLMDAVSALALAYYLTGAARYAERAALDLRVWFLDPATRMNPHLEYGQAIPGRVTGRGTGIIDTLGLIGTVDAAGLLYEAGALSPEEYAGLQAWFGDYLTWLLESGHGRDEAAAHNNHGTWYDAQVVSFARFVGRDDLARRTLAESTRARIASQIPADGSQPHELARTKAFSYSVMNLRGFFTLAALGEPLGVDLWRHVPEGSAGLQGALDYLLPYADPALPWPYPQIEPASRVTLLPLLLQGVRVYGEARYREASGRLPAEEAARDRAWLLYGAGAGL